MDNNLDNIFHQIVEGLPPKEAIQRIIGSIGKGVAGANRDLHPMNVQYSPPTFKHTLFHHYDPPELEGRKKLKMRNALIDSRRVLPPHSMHYKMNVDKGGGIRAKVSHGLFDRNKIRANFSGDVTPDELSAFEARLHQKLAGRGFDVLSHVQWPGPADVLDAVANAKKLRESVTEADDQVKKDLRTVRNHVAMGTAAGAATGAYHGITGYLKARKRHREGLIKEKPNWKAYAQDAASSTLHGAKMGAIGGLTTVSVDRTISAYRDRRRKA